MSRQTVVSHYLFPGSETRTIGYHPTFRSRVGSESASCVADTATRVVPLREFHPRDWIARFESCRPVPQACGSEPPQPVPRNANNSPDADPVRNLVAPSNGSRLSSGAVKKDYF